jgi:hypothetical protein
MARNIQTLLLAALIGSLGCAAASPPAAVTRPAATSATDDAAHCNLPDSLRVKMVAALARGDIATAIGLWQAHHGKPDTIPRALRAFQSAYHASNRRPGACQDVARQLHEGFKFVGGSPQYLRISASPSSRAYLSWQGRQIISDNRLHFVVHYKDKVYDAFTGPQGMPLKEYLSNLMMDGKPIIETVIEP